MINNLTQFKEAIKNKKCFIILEHNVLPECNGQIRQPSKIQNDCFYTVIKNQPDHNISKSNNGLGYRLDYPQKDEIEFNGKYISLYHTWKPPHKKPFKSLIMKIKFLAA